MSNIIRHKTTARASMIVIHNGTIFLSGQVAADVSADIQTQTRSVLDKIDALLAEAGSSNENILSAIIYIKDIADNFAPMNEIWNAWVPEGHAPARACVQALMARSNILVEISIVAVVK